MAAISDAVKVIKYDAHDPRLGRHVEHDSRSWSYRFLEKRTPPKRVDTMWRSSAPTIDQGELGCCTGVAMAQWLNTDFAEKARTAKNAGRYLDIQDALDLYAKASELDNIPGQYPAEDTGSTGNAVAKAARSFGWIKNYGWLFNYNSIQAAIERSPLLVGTVWTDDMYSPNNGLVTVGAITRTSIVGGHEYLMVGIDYGQEIFKFRQSWGESPGYKPGGYFAIGFRDFAMLLAENGDVTIPKLP